MTEVANRDAGRLIGAARARQRLTLDRLAVRSGISPARLGKIETGSEDVDQGELARILLVLGEELAADGRSSRPLRRDYDEADLRLALSRTPSQRLADAIAANRFADQLARAGAAARAPATSDP